MPDRECNIDSSIAISSIVTAKVTHFSELREGKGLQCAFSPLKSQAAVAFCMETGSVLCQNGMRFVSKRKVFWPKSPYILLPRPVSSSVTNRQQEGHEPAVGDQRGGWSSPLKKLVLTAFFLQKKFGYFKLMQYLCANSSRHAS